MMNKSFMRAVILGFSLSAALLGWHPCARADQVLSIPLATVRILQLQEPAKDVIIADPGIADVTMQAPDRMVIIGKQAGRTSLIILDANQKVILSRMVVVADGDGGLVVVHGPRGGTMSQDSYACAEHCTLIPGSGMGGSGGGGAFSNNPLPTDAATSQANDSNQIQRVDTKIKMKVQPNGTITGTRTDVPVYGSPQ